LTAHIARGEYVPVTLDDPMPDKVRAPKDRSARAPAVRRTLWFILALNALVVVVKIVVGVRTGALSVLGAALESALDALNNLIGMVLVGLAAREPDEEHPYGHDKFETLGALAIVVFLSISCFELLRAAVLQLVRGPATTTPDVADLGLLGFTALVNVFVVWYERRRGRELASAFLLADAAHTGSDLWVTLLAVASLLLGRLGFATADPVLALVVAAVIAWNGYQILRQTVPILVDERGVDADEIRGLVSRIPLIEDVRDVRSRSTSSGVLFAEVTIGVAASTSVADAHDLADAVEARIAEALGAAEVTVHVEPV
jgi:cation diffusion facilitator family transporter